MATVSNRAAWNSTVRGSPGCKGYLTQQVLLELLAWVRRVAAIVHGSRLLGNGEPVT